MTTEIPDAIRERAAVLLGTPLAALTDDELRLVKAAALEAWRRAYARKKERMLHEAERRVRAA